MSTKSKKTKPKKEPTVVLHASTGGGKLHVVGIGNLRVMITHDECSWFARGLEIDYAVQGESLNDVKKRFHDGLRQTVRENLKVYGSVEHILKIAPAEVWNEYFINAEALRKIHSQVTTHNIAIEPLPDDIQNKLPFERIAYVPPAHSSLGQPNV